MTMADEDRKYFDRKLDSLKSDVQKSIADSAEHIKEVVREKILTVETGVKLNKESIIEIKAEQKDITEELISVREGLKHHKENHRDGDDKKKTNIGYIVTIALFGIGWVFTILLAVFGKK